DQRSFGTPAMRVAVSDLVYCHQSAFALEDVDDFFINLVNVITCYFTGSCNKNTVFVDQIQCADAIGLTHNKVFHTVVRRRVYRTGTGVSCHVITKQYRNLTIYKRMLQQRTLKRRTLDDTQTLGFFDAVTRHDLFLQFYRDHQQLVTAILAGRSTQQCVFQLSVQGYSLVGRKGPGSCSPDHNGQRQIFYAASIHSKRLEPEFTVYHRETHVDGE